MQDDAKQLLDSCELSSLWESYMAESLTICMFKYFLNNVDDDDTRSILKYTFDLSNQYLKELTSFFNQSALPIPEGFTDKDVYINAPRLFTDEFYLFYLSDKARSGMLKYTQSLSYSSRSDIRAYFAKRINESSDLYNKVAEIRLSKGIFIRTPIVEVPKMVQYIKSQKFLLDWFGEKRSMILSEINQISIVILSDIMGKALTTGFGQVSKTKEIAEYMFRGRDISTKKISIFSSILANENIPIPSTSNSFVSDSKIAPFSEKLMLFHIVVLGSISILNKGIALANNLRSDLETNYLRLLAENMKYTKDGANILIDKKWFEQPPQAIKHEELAEV